MGKPTEELSPRAKLFKAKFEFGQIPAWAQEKFDKMNGGKKEESTSPGLKKMEQHLQVFEYAKLAKEDAQKKKTTKRGQKHVHVSGPSVEVLNSPSARRVQ